MNFGDNDNTKHSINAQLRESILEKLFVGELLKHCWNLDIFDVEVLKSEFDSFGYDIVIVHGNIIRHVQLKTRLLGRKGGVKVGLKLSEKPGGCVVLMLIDEQLNIVGFRWFGGQPTEILPDIHNMKIAKHTKGNAVGIKSERVDHREVPLGKFVFVSDINEMLNKLLGINSLSTI